jgi:hypothetical protein
MVKVSKEHRISPNTIYSWLGSVILKPYRWKEFFSLQKQNKELLSLIGKLTIKLSQAQKRVSYETG